MGDLIQEVRHSLRSLTKQRGFSAVVVLTLALGIGLNTAVFSVVDAVLFRPLPFANPERLVDIWEQSEQYSLASIRTDQIAVWKEQTNVFAGVQSYDRADFTMTGGAEPELVPAAAVGPGFFSFLGVAPQLGRAFVEEETMAGAPRVVILSDTFWRTRFGKRPDIIGTTITLRDEAYTVVGVMPSKFKFPYSLSTFWVPLTNPAADAAATGAKTPRRNAIARVKEGMSFQVAQTALDALVPALTKDRPDANWSVKLMPLEDHRVNPRPRQALLVLLGAVGFVLLLTCANAANLLLARAASREGEIAVRLAMGAPRPRLVRQLLMENLILAAAGGTLGVLFAWMGVGALERIVPDELTFLTVAKIDMDPRVLFFSLAVTLFTGIAFGLVPTLRMSRPNLQAALGLAAAKTTADRAHGRLSQGLVILEVALSLVLLVGAGLMMRSFITLSSEKPGFDPTHLIAADLSLPKHRYQTPEFERAFYDGLKTTIATSLGVESVSVSQGLPPSGMSFSFDLDVEIQGRPPLPKDKELLLPFSRVDADFFKTMRIPILRGRAFSAEDATDPEPLMIINQEMAARFWPNENPVDQRIRFSKDAKWKRVVGVAGNVIAGKPGSGMSRMVAYYPMVQTPNLSGQRTLIVRTAGDAEALIPAMKARIWSVDKDQPIHRIDTAETRLAGALAEPRFYLQLLGCFALVTLLLVSMGIYGVMAHAVALRTREMGIRQALGAGRRDVLHLVFKRGLLLTSAGIVVGAGAALSMSRVMKAFLFGTPVADPQTYALVALLMTLVAMIACWVPARRAANVDPMVALRQE